VPSARRAIRRKSVDGLGATGPPRTSRSSSLYLALVSIRKRLTKDEEPPGALVKELEQLLTLCEGKLARIKPDVEDALKIARGA